MIWWTKTGFGYKAVCEVRSRHWLVIGQCGETLVNTRFFCARPRSTSYLRNFSVRTSEVLYLYYLVIEFFASYSHQLRLKRS